jgi:hypothetical protein
VIATDQHRRCTKSIGRENAGNLSRGRKPEHQHIAPIGFADGGARRADVDAGDGQQGFSYGKG